MYESIYVEIMIMLRVKKEADFSLKKVRRPKIIFWRSVQYSAFITRSIVSKIYNGAAK